MPNVQKLIEDNMKLVYYVIRTRFPRYTTDEDLIQAGMLGLCKAANAWDETKGIFSSFAVKGIYFEICKEFKRRKRQKFTYSLDYEYSYLENEPSTLGDVLVGDSDVDWFDYESFYDVLTEKERVIVDMKLQGLTGREIAKTIGGSNQNVSACLRRARKRLEKANDD
jgi:RNA polymerase sigma factor (sigma-70 family)